MSCHKKEERRDGGGSECGHTHKQQQTKEEEEASTVTRNWFSFWLKMLFFRLPFWIAIQRCLNRKSFDSPLANCDVRYKYDSDQYVTSSFRVRIHRALALIKIWQTSISISRQKKEKERKEKEHNKTRKKKVHLIYTNTSKSRLNI